MWFFWCLQLLKDMLEDRACLISMVYLRLCEWSCSWRYISLSLEKGEIHHTEKPLEEEDAARKLTKLLGEEDAARKLPKQLDDQMDTSLTIGRVSRLINTSSLLEAIGRDNSINCLVRCSRADYGMISSLNSSFRSLVRSGELYRLRKLGGVVEHWVYLSCQLLEWEAFDPISTRWVRLPRMEQNDCFAVSDKESLAVGTELLVFGRDIMSHVIYRYSLLTNTWATGMRTHAPRCLFGSASLGEIAILAGGCDYNGNVLSSAEMYNSELGTWRTLPSMGKPRKMCSAVFMDGKFYVVGGIGGANSELLACGEEYDMDTGSWTEIPNMSPVRTLAATEPPPLIAVVGNELYVANYANMEIRKYDKGSRVWGTVGRLPEPANSMHGWGLAFRACGDRLLVIGGSRNAGEEFIEVNSWKPSEGPPQWRLLDKKRSRSFVFNCAVMGC